MAEKVKTEKRAVPMQDGRTVSFGMKQKLLKEVLFGESGMAQGVRFDLDNGASFEFRLDQVSNKIASHLMAHGAAQKIGDECADLDSTSDYQEAIEAMIDRLTGGQWNSERQAFSGQSVLIEACIEAFGKSREEVKTILKDLKPKEKTALRATEPVKAIADRIEAERAKSSKVDLSGVFGKLQG